MDTFTAAAKAVLIEAENAGINACSTPARTQQGWNLVASAPMEIS
jgi:hypothetical protein